MWRRMTVLILLFVGLACEDVSGPQAEGEFELQPVPQVIYRSTGTRDSLVWGELRVTGDRFTVALARHTLRAEATVSIDTIRDSGRARGNLSPGGCGNHYASSSGYISTQAGGIVEARLDIVDFASLYWRRTATAAATQISAIASPYE